VWHHRRDSPRAYWKQQVGYGKAEALLARKWPEKYNGMGHLAWSGRLYGRGLTEAIRFRRGRIEYGIWGTQLFQSIYQPAPGVLGSLPLMPEWYLLLGLLTLFSALSLVWTPLLVTLPLVALAAGASLIQAALSAAGASFNSTPQSRTTRLKLRLLTTFLHLLQPLARLRGRLLHGLNPWRQAAVTDRALPRPRACTTWSEQWWAPEQWLRSAESALAAHGLRVQRGGAFDRWDLQVRVGILGMVRVLMVAEEHGAGRQLLRFRVWPVLMPRALVASVLASALSAGAAFDGAWIVSLVFGTLLLLTALRLLRDGGAATSRVHSVLSRMRPSDAELPSAQQMMVANGDATPLAPVTTGQPVTNGRLVERQPVERRREDQVRAQGVR
jgi:hypothetical protein